MTLLKVLNADMTSPFQGFKFECQKWYHCPDFDPGDAECSNGFYCAPIDGLHYAYRTGRRVFVAKVKGQSRIFDCMKQRYEDMMLTDELTADQIIPMALDAEQRVGYRLAEVLFPINPLLLPKITPTSVDIDLLEQWQSALQNVAPSMGLSVWESMVASVGYSVGASVWDSVEDSVGYSVVTSVVASVQGRVQASVQGKVQDRVQDSVWGSMGTYIGSLFLRVASWNYIDHNPGVYPFQAGADLWRRGLVPSYDGRIWRLHSGAKAEIVWENK